MGFLEDEFWKQETLSNDEFTLMQEKRRNLLKLIYENLDGNQEKYFFRGYQPFFNFRDLGWLEQENFICVYEELKIRGKLRKVKKAEYQVFGNSGLKDVNLGLTFSIYDVLSGSTAWNFKESFSFYQKKEKLFLDLLKIDL